MILIVIALMVLLTISAKPFWDMLGFDINYTLWNREETYLPIFAIFSMGIVGIIDDYLNVRNV